MDILKRSAIFGINLESKEFDSVYAYKPSVINLTLDGELYIETEVVNMMDFQAKIHEISFKTRVPDDVMKNLILNGDDSYKFTILLSRECKLDEGIPVPGAIYAKMHNVIRSLSLVDINRVGRYHLSYNLLDDPPFEVTLTDKMFVTYAKDISAVYLIGVTTTGEYVILYNTNTIYSQDLNRLAVELKNQTIRCIKTKPISHIIYQNASKKFGPFIETTIASVM